MGVSAPERSMNAVVRGYWEEEPCGSGVEVVGDAPRLSREWFARIEENRYRAEPFIHAVAQFTRHRGERVLEVGVGAGTDHLQWARAGAQCYGVDLTDAAIETARAHLAVHGLESQLQRVDAETLPFEDGFFDTVYSWGVVHHTEHPDRMLREIRRVLRPGGQFIGMLYGRHSAVAVKMWLRHALFAGRPGRTLSDVIWHHCESLGTKAYTCDELAALFGEFSSCTLQPILTPYDTKRLPRRLTRWFPQHWGWFIAVRATK
jgi:SAM-dependent methyltransferase